MGRSGTEGWPSLRHVTDTLGMGTRLESERSIALMASAPIAEEVSMLQSGSSADG
jgi:hypothetical protein